MAVANRPLQSERASFLPRVAVALEEERGGKREAEQEGGRRPDGEPSVRRRRRRLTGGARLSGIRRP